MKRMLPLLTIVLFGIVLLAGSCKHRSTVAELGLTFDTLRADTTALLVDSGPSPRCHVHLELVTFKGEAYAHLNDSLLRSGLLQPDYLSLLGTHVAPRAAVDSFMERYVNDYRDFYSTIFTDEPDTAALTLDYTIATEIEEGRGSVLCHIAHVSQRQGTMTTEHTQVHNADMKQRKWLSLDDIFVPGYERTLNDLIVRELQRRTGTSDLSGLRQAGYFVNSDVYPTPNFKMGADDLTLIYVTGEIADRERGEQSIGISYSDLKTILRQ